MQYMYVYAIHAEGVYIDGYMVYIEYRYMCKDAGACIGQYPRGPIGRLPMPDTAGRTRHITWMRQCAFSYWGYMTVRTRQTLGALRAEPEPALFCTIAVLVLLYLPD